ncbi:similar to Saccharomyces cerevisiae YOL078W AVO1 Component of a membrane-bound complex containing the Tor2p kinase and other proteins, which may have a role in regulation of cell growth [Maudiozyma saulgeensis]|uniref:Similar to Saccharomyces cerevisiae YOL078W AVO1 Component of a membrane-bound complex containing the Tor2p kinase and other proteins, which may have a role in regulation of cell growth n=1 Tax=Maudiozyma saulgeensis TaxID=1789683 RepID=A0A1X7RBP1_9SACH|nr:similar to Saccharomyces cerevisiae YOL078W AVO1 Component of a membrane-bound complex containing the Tor2p kinase and other proteins, which may have a role in regulation of cell growth [Kazachstania saulgeensis]
MDTSVAVNSLRAQFLKVCPERDQVRRIVKPYDSKNHNNYTLDDIDDKVKDMYRNNNGTYMLPELESLPIMTNFLEDYITTRKIRNAKANNKNNNNGSSNNIHDEDIQGQETLTKKSQLMDDPSILRGDSMLFNPQEVDRLTSDNTKLNNNYGRINGNNGVPQFASVTYDSDDSDSESQTKHKISALPFTRIFKGNKKDPNGKNTTSRTTSITSNSTRGTATTSNSAAAIAQKKLKKHSKYSMNFDYDDILDEDLEDEGEDEEENNEDNQLKSQFFQLDRSTSALNDNTNSNTNTHGPTNNGNSNIAVDKLKIGTKAFSLDRRSLLENAFSLPKDNDVHIRSDNSDHSLSNTSQQGNNTNDTVSTSGNIINVSRLKSHLPQIPILDSSRNNGNSNINNNNGNGNTSKNAQSDKELNKNSKSDSKIGDSDLSDIESFIKEDDLKSINLDHHNSNNNKSMASSPIDSKPVAYAHSVGMVHSEGLSEDDDIEDGDSNMHHTQDSTSEHHDLSEVSSFGKSLLESEYTSNEYLKTENSDSATDHMSLDTDIVHHTISSHSIPLSFEGYGLYQGANDSTLNNVLDRAVTKIKSNAPHIGRDRANSATSRRNSITQVLNSKRASLTSNPMMKQNVLRHHLRSTSNNAAENSKYSGVYGSSLHKNKTLLKNEPLSKAPVPSRSSSRTSRRSSRDISLHFEKIPTSPIPKTTNSHLSSLFNKKKHKVTNPVEVLEYFSFVSGNTVPRFDAMDLEVYIQLSKKYKRNSFKTKVRKTAKIFDVIGYILYLYTTEFKPDNMDQDGLDMRILINPNNFALHIVDEDGEPFEDNFGKLNRTSTMQSISDNEIVLCRVGEEEKLKNDEDTPVPYDVNGDVIEYAKSISSKASGGTNNEDNTLNQLSFYKPIVGGNVDDLANNANSSNVLEVTVYKYPNINPKFNFTTINVLVTGNINDILVKYCRMKNMDPNEYSLKMIGKNRIFDLNDTVLRLDGNNKVEIISKKEARRLQLEKIKPNLTKPQLPTIQSNDLTPMTLEPAPAFMTTENSNDGAAPATEVPVPFTKLRKTSGKIKLNLSKQPSSGSNNVGSNNSGSFFKNKDSSRHSLHTPMQTYHNNHSGILNEYTPDNETSNNNFQDLFSGAYHKYKVWRRQQMSLINKHERTLALDGDYVYIVPPEGKMHWHENVKTKSFHISQVILVKKSKRVAEYFKIYVRRGPDDIKRYYFEAVSAQECTEIVSRITNLLNAYKMNHK